MTATLDAMETVLRLERALAANGGRQLTDETRAAAATEMAAARAEIRPMVSEDMDWAFQTVATYRADRRRLEAMAAKARRNLKKAEEEGAAAAAAAAKKFVGVRAALEAKKTPAAVTAAKEEIAVAELALTELEKENRFMERLVTEECEFQDGLQTIREWTARGSTGTPPAAAVSWIAASKKAKLDLLGPLNSLTRWVPSRDHRVYADVTDSTDDDVNLWSLPEPEVPIVPVVEVRPVMNRPKKPVIPADETPAQRKRRMLFRKLQPVAV
jgi:hypothetical protein